MPLEMTGDLRFDGKQWFLDLFANDSHTEVPVSDKLKDELHEMGVPFYDADSDDDG